MKKNMLNRRRNLRKLYQAAAIEEYKTALEIKVELNKMALEFNITIREFNYILKRMKKLMDNVAPDENEFRIKCDCWNNQGAK